MKHAPKKMKRYLIVSSISLVFTIFQLLSSKFHSPEPESCPHRNYQDARIHENYNHQVSLPLHQLNSYNLPQKADPVEWQIIGLKQWMKVETQSRLNDILPRTFISKIIADMLKSRIMAEYHIQSDKKKEIILLKQP